jgi:4-alpha-glucanotransferase
MMVSSVIFFVNLPFNTKDKLMQIKFTINYITSWGQTLYLMIQSSDDKAFSNSEAIVMECDQKYNWTALVDSPEGVSTISYQYAILDLHKEFEHECGNGRILHFPVNAESIEVRDLWRNACGDAPFLTSAFFDCIFRRKTTATKPSLLEANISIRLICPQIESYQHIAIVGNHDVLGNWDVNKKVKLDDRDFPIWKVDFNRADFTHALEYKYLLVDSLTNEVIGWELGKNRVITDITKGSYTIINDQYFQRSIPNWKGAGVAIPVFSLRSEDSFGIGEFNDLKKMVDWAKLTNQRLIQTLPINDTILYHNNHDSYPYNALSIFALHPIYLNLELMGELKDDKLKRYFAQRKEEFNRLSFADYQNVLNVKWEYFKLIYDQEKANTFQSESYKSFYKENESWLRDYAVFSYFRDLYNTPDFSTWDENSKYDLSIVIDLCQPSSACYNQIAFFFFLQYHAYIQLCDAHQYALDNGIALKGDIPIGISPFSVGAWARPNLFNTNVQAGAPPDDFSVTGQNWGFPTYNWDVMAENGYKWWCNRFEKMAQYFDAYRIDHILGFFRIWEIPSDAVWGLTGRFNPALPFSIKELQERGLTWDADRFIKPYITNSVIESTFGIYTEETIDIFLDKGENGFYTFKAEFDTQKKIQKYYSSVASKMDTKDELIRNGLYTLHCQVLFLEDFNEKDKYHPRISTHQSASFKELSEETQQLIDQIYVDYFYHRHNEFWKESALKKLPALIASTNMLVCGEDLGMIPATVPSVMRELEIMSLEIQRMPKKSGVEFGLPSEAPYLSVCTTSTHDMSTLRAWWEEDLMATRRYYNGVLGMNGLAPKVCDTWISERIINQHLFSSAMWVILPWQDWMALDATLRRTDPLEERINVPSSPNNFWCFRMHITLEKLISADNFNNKVADLIRSSGR